ncbi:MAG: chorismate synthase [Deltaproteobacteria bacterium]|nr:chorismate synthase [Deltaproteobacteria bacterium]
MAGNTIGELFRVTTFGESHGRAVGAVIDGCPSNIVLSESDFVADMERRRPGKTTFDSPRKETDQVEILSGVFEGKTTGGPLALLVRNRDVDSRPYDILRSLYRPGHADFTYEKKYGHIDHRGGGRSSARETAARVAAGVVARKILEAQGIELQGFTLELGGIRAVRIDVTNAASDPLSCPDPAVVAQMARVIEDARKAGDSVGGIVELRVRGCPIGLGEPVFDKLDADLAKAVMSVGTVKGVEIGCGFAAARLRGSENNDPIVPEGFKSNNAGGILGGISNGDEIILRAAVKPIPSIAKEQETIDRQGRPAVLELTGRHDTCAVPRIIPVLEAMVAIVLADHLFRWKAFTGAGLRESG